jgi:hypothetical protein
MLDVQTIAGFQCKRDCEREGSRAMAGETEEPHDAAARLEAALERIAAAAAQRASAGSGGPVAAPVAAEPPAGEAGGPIAPEIAVRLDGLIERLRGALAVRAG